MKRTPLQWFNNWESIVKREKKLSRVALSEYSGASLWVIKGLQRDFLEWAANIKYEDNYFVLMEVSDSLTLTLSNKEELK